MTCYYCGMIKGSHDPACPEKEPCNQIRRNRWHQGFSDGKEKEKLLSRDPTYILGYNQGAISLERAE